VTDNQGQYMIRGVAPGDYIVTVNYVGFLDFTMQVHVAEGQAQRVDATLRAAGQSEQVFVTAKRPRGEAAEINRQRTADNIVRVLSSEVITSLPNANIADALGRLPSVTLERDEGEGKYVQIRGTEPRLSSLTIDGVNVPSPETGVRHIKMDTLASDLVESIEINNIYAYQYQNLNSDGSPMAAGDLTAAGLTGPGGDNYLYSHLQIDAQATVRVPPGFSFVAYGLNLNNEVFGFYNGSPQYVVQREFYKPTFAIGVRINPSLK